MSLVARVSIEAGPPCFPNAPIPGWSVENVGGFGNGSSELQAQEYKLCSDSSGFGVSDDKVRYVFKGTGGDFLITVRVDDFDAPGIGGLMVREDPQRIDSAFIAIYVQFQSGTGNFVINSSFRPDGGAQASLDVGPVISTGLPVYLRISRSAGVLTSAFSPNGNNYVNHLQAGGPLTDLAASSVTAGLVQSSQNPLVTSTAYLSNPVLVALGNVGYPIDLGDVATGGDGTGTAPPANTGIDERTGDFTTDYFDGPVSMGDAVDDGRNPSPASDSAYIDSVFFIEPGLPGTGAASQVITQSGVRFDSFRSTDGNGTGWNYILKNRNGGVSTPGIQVGGIAIPTGSAVGIHASMGITFDLNALRARHGADRVGCFESFWGMDNCDAGDVNLYAILSSDAGVIAGGSRSFHALPGAGEWVQMEIPATARYLTLATGTNNGGACGHGTFGAARITCSPCPLPSFTDIGSVEPRLVSTTGGTEITLTGKGLGPDYQYVIGGRAVTGIVPLDSSGTQLRGIAPALPAGSYDAQVLLATGGIVACLKDAVDAGAPPSITSVGPRNVSRDGTTSISVHGGNFTTGTRIQIGGRDLASPSFVSSSLITGNAPALAAGESDGPRDVTAQAPTGNAILPAGVVYVTPQCVQIQKVTPSFVSTAGGTPIEITGTCFAAGMVARLDGTPILEQVLVSSTTLRGKSPPLPAGLHAAEIVDAAGAVLAHLDHAVESGSLLRITSVDPRRVARDGTTPVSIHGEGFNAATMIHIGSHPLARPQLASPSLMTGLAPALDAAELDGPRDVVAEGSSGSSALTGGVHYVSPAVKTLTFTERFAPEDLSLTPITMPDGTPATRVRLRGGDISAKAGEPALPVIYRRVALPKGALVVDVEANPATLQTFAPHPDVEWQQPRQPIQAAGRVPRPPIITGGDDGPIYFPPPEPVPLDPSVHSTPAWPREEVSIEDAAEQGEFLVLSCRISPVTWKPAEGTIELRMSLDVHVFYEGGSLPDPAAPIDYRTAMMREEVGSAVVNHDLVPPSDGNAILPPLTLDAWYLIITDNDRWNEDKTPNGDLPPGDMVSEFERLAHWKNQKGIKAAVVTVRDILLGRYGNFSAGSRDLEEVIRKFLRHAKESFNTYWVLIGGDQSIIPARRAPIYLAPLKFASNSTPDRGEAYLDPGTRRIRVQSGSDWLSSTDLTTDPERIVFFHGGTGMAFKRTQAPSDQNPGWSYMTNSSYSQESQYPTPYVIVAGVPLDVQGGVPVPPTDLYLANWVSHIPTDLYYASVNGNWDQNGNGVLGEILGDASIDGVSFAPDFALGRAPLHWTADVGTWVDKVLAYEKYANVPGNFAEKVLLGSTNWWGGALVSAGSKNPPPQGRYFSSNGSTEAHLHFTGAPGTNAYAFALVAYNSENDLLYLPYDRNAGPERLGFHYCTDESYSQVSEYGVNLGKPTEWVLVMGPAAKIHPASYFFDYVLADASALTKEQMKKLFDADFPGLDLKKRYYEDAEDTPDWPSSDLFIMKNDLVAPLNAGANLVSLSGHGLWTGCCGLSGQSILSLTNGNQGGLVYADSCFTGRFEVADSAANYFMLNSKGGGVAWVGNSSYGWIGDDAYELNFWDQLQADRHAGRLLTTKWWITTSVYDKWANYSLHLLGDPEMPLWIGPPGRLNVDYNPCPKPGDNFPVQVADAQNQPIVHASVCVSSDDGLFFDCRWTQSNGNTVFTTSGWPKLPHLQLTVTVQDFMPYEASVDLTGVACASIAYFRGDSNGDAKDDLSDAVYTLNYLFLGGTAPRCLDAADVNDDGKVDISDAIRLLGFLFLGEPAPPGYDPAG
ncbi:MAG TPA: C25 family cysteine peptidase, partial [Planctomycetota bacterium]|nr:C25 family cysteine peptidase [Planctomycetota bacterium]